MTVLLLAFAVAAGVIGWIVGEPWLRQRRREALQRQALPADWQARLRQQPLYRRLPRAFRGRLDRLVQVFIAEKEFIGCDGLEVDLGMRLTIAAQACLLLVNRPDRNFDRLHSILVYPDEFVVTGSHEDEHGIVTDGPRVLAGEAHEQHRILLSWRDVRARGQGYNVVIHEFAHYLDQDDGAVNGAPDPAAAAADRERWALVLAAELDLLRELADRGEPTLLDPYAAQDEGEFFAVASEAFFELPRELQAERPALYRELAGFYRLDPALW